MIQDFLLRLRVILIAALLLAATTGVLVFPAELSAALDQLAKQPVTTRQVMVVVAVMVDMLFLAVIYQELQSRPPTTEGVLVKNNAGISLDLIQNTVNQQICQLAGIQTVFTRARAVKGRVELQIEIYGEENLHIPQAIQQIERESNKVVQKQMGLKLAGKPLIHFAESAAPKPVLDEDKTQPLPLDEDKTILLPKTEPRQF